MRYRIEGDNLPVVICTLSQGERMLTEKGAMSWMTPNMQMETSMAVSYTHLLAPFSQEAATS